MNEHKIDHYFGVVVAGELDVELGIVVLAGCKLELEGIVGFELVEDLQLNVEELEVVHRNLGNVQSVFRNECLGRGCRMRIECWLQSHDHHVV